MEKEDKEIYGCIFIIMAVLVAFTLCFLYQNKKLQNTFRQESKIGVNN